MSPTTNFAVSQLRRNVTDNVNPHLGKCMDIFHTPSLQHSTMHCSSKKKNAALNRLNAGKQEIRDLRADIIKLDHLDDEMDKLSVNGRRVMEESELKQYMNCFRNKTEKCKQCKLRLQSERNELSILQRTKEILRARDSRLA
eukprot:826912_1